MPTDIKATTVLVTKLRRKRESLLRKSLALLKGLSSRYRRQSITTITSIATTITSSSKNITAATITSIVVTIAIFTITLFIYSVNNTIKNTTLYYKDLVFFTTSKNDSLIANII